MNFSICLDQTTTPNFNVTNLSTTGFSIYSNLNLNSPLVQNIPYTSLFESPLGTCPFNLTNIPEGTDYLIVVDQCNTSINVSSIFTPENINAGSITINCCYAIINLNPTPLSICGQNGCNLSFDTFSTSTVGQIIAGNLSSTCGVITDYTIGWYRNGNYSSPEFISGFGNAFLPYDNLHPLTVNQAVPCLAGNWEGIIHDIAIGGTIYSSIAGTANGVSIPFSSCFDTVVVDPLTCANGPVSSSISKYSHQFNYNSQAIGTSPLPVSLTYVLDASVKYFAYAFSAFSVWDEIEIKWISGNPSVTSNPSLYSQPIYLEKLKIGSDVFSTPPYPVNLPSIAEINTPYNGFYEGMNNSWPKAFLNTPVTVNKPFQRTLTLTTLETSSNPSLPDRLEIIITPNPTNNNTKWAAGFQCLTNFTCDNCVFEDWPNNIGKIWKLQLQKTYGCGTSQRLKLNYTASCDYGLNRITSDWMGKELGTSTTFPPFVGNDVNLINSYELLPLGSTIGGNLGSSTIPQAGIQFQNSTTSCLGCANSSCGGTFNCNPTPTTNQITLNKSPNIIELIFNSETEYFYYRDSLVNAFNLFNTQTPISCSGTTSINYYGYITLGVPIQLPNANCGDTTTTFTARFHINDYFDIQYIESPSTNTWSITIPQTLMVNCYPPNLPCTNCYAAIQGFVNYYNSTLSWGGINSTTFTTNVGAKFNNPFQSVKVSTSTPFPLSLNGSYCYQSPLTAQKYHWYATHTVPFISSSLSSTGWTNLSSLIASVPCLPAATSSFIYPFDHPRGGSYIGYTSGYQIRFPHLTSSFNYAFGPGNSYSTNDFEIYALTGKFGGTGSLNQTPNVFPHICPDPSGSLIYRYSGSIATVYSSSYFAGGSPTLVIDP